MVSLDSTPPSLAKPVRPPRVGSVGMGGFAACNHHTVAELEKAGRCRLICTFDPSPTRVSRGPASETATSSPLEVRGLEQSLREFVSSIAWPEGDPGAPVQATRLPALSAHLDQLLRA